MVGDCVGVSACVAVGVSLLEKERMGERERDAGDNVRAGDLVALSNAVLEIVAVDTAVSLTETEADAAGVIDPDGDALGLTVWACDADELCEGEGLCVVEGVDEGVNEGVGGHVALPDGVLEPLGEGACDDV